MHNRYIEVASINISIPVYVLQKTADAFNEVGKPLKGSRYWF